MKKQNTRLSTSAFQKLKTAGHKIVMATAYDYPSARLLDLAGIDVILVGDSVGMVVQGRESTLPVTLDEMIYHAEMVVRGTQKAMVVVDMPFPYCQLESSRVLDAAARIMKETGAGAVKLEGGFSRADTVGALVDAGIPVMAHCGLQPQSLRRLGGYRVQRDEDRLLCDVKAVVDAGAFSVLLECVASTVAADVVQTCPVPVIGIGSGPACDGQVLVFHDILNYNDVPDDELPRHVRSYANVGSIIKSALTQYAKDVREGIFPSDKESF
ncbi:MAG: 3-methyl-2-oxobutanoate hydroxymethyltransferase [Thermoguttaceae bacterium]|nr:3-methyl-2-oxobutanoate hydroxymethyltransferase [Thermoguttaceae bacterium]